MLTHGVERIIEQVINPKILQVIKPKIDDVVCEHLGIDPKARQDRLERKARQQQQQQHKNLVSLMSLSTTPPGGEFYLRADNSLALVSMGMYYQSIYSLNTMPPGGEFYLVT
jgi:hypothetical protein